MLTITRPPAFSVGHAHLAGTERSGSESFAEIYDCKPIEAVLAELDVELVHISGNSFVEPEPEQLQRLRKALTEAGSPIILSCVLSKVSFLVMPESMMLRYTQMPEFSGAYSAGSLLILLNEHLFAPDKRHFQQLIGVLRNELSHAYTEITHRQLEAEPIDNPYDSLKPWRTSAQQQLLEKNYGLFRNRVARFQRLEQTPNKRLSYQKKKN